MSGTCSREHQLPSVNGVLVSGTCSREHQLPSAHSLLVSGTCSREHQLPSVNGVLVSGTCSREHQLPSAHSILVSGAVLSIWLHCTVNLCRISGAVLLLFLWLFPPSRVVGMTADLPSPHRHVRLLARSQSSTFQVSLAQSILFSVVLSSFSVVYPFSTLSSACVLHLSS